MKGILLAGGTGSRVWPMSKSVNKHLLPIFDKPMIYYPLTTLMLAGLREILIISSERDIFAIKELLGSGEKIGLDIQYKIQDKPEGLAQSIILAEEFLDGGPSTLVLGDNLFHGKGMTGLLEGAVENLEHRGGCQLFATSVPDPSRFGIVEVDEVGSIINIEEKPANPKSNLAVVGLYMYDGTAPMRAKSLKPSSRGELEITDLNMSYVKEGKGVVSEFGRGVTWLDTGTPMSLQSASAYIHAVQTNTGKKIACIEEVSWRKGNISKKIMLEAISDYPEGNEYGEYIRSL